MVICLSGLSVVPQHILQHRRLLLLRCHPVIIQIRGCFHWMFQSDGACWRHHHASDESALKELGYRIPESQRQSFDGFVCRSFRGFESNAHRSYSNWTSFINTSSHLLNSCWMALSLLDCRCWSILVWYCLYHLYCGKGCRFRFARPDSSHILFLLHFSSGPFALESQLQVPHEYFVEM